MSQLDDDANRWGNDEPDDASEVTCGHCNAHHLTWHHTGLRYVRLTVDNRIHDCRVNETFEKVNND